MTILSLFLLFLQNHSSQSCLLFPYTGPTTHRESSPQQLPAEIQQKGRGGGSGEILGTGRYIDDVVGTDILL